MKQKIHYLPCECIGGAKECGWIGIANFGEGLEISFTKDKRKEAKNAVYITKPKTLEIFRKIINS